ncbi:MAG: response regulator transcription factor [Rhodospirillales bacterium]
MTSQTGRKLIYVVEDDRDICDIVRNALEEHGYEVRIFYDGTSATREVRRRPPDLAIIDILLPDFSGLNLVKEIWHGQDGGIFVLTGLGDLADRVLGLEFGADDYIVKPFEPRELVARIKSYFRRVAKVTEGIQSANIGRARFADHIFDPGTLTLTNSAGDVEAVSAREARILLTLLKAPNQVLNRAQLLDLGRPCDMEANDRSVDVRISRIRRKIADDPKDPKIIKTIYGAGYLLAAQVEWLD